MRRMICLIGVFLLCVTMVCPAYAATTEFVPSISYKDGPEADSAILAEEDKLDQGEQVGKCVVVTSITEAKEKTTDIYQETRDELLEVYGKLSDGSMTLPLDKGYVVRELVDVSFKASACVESDHTHEEELNVDGIVAVVDFDLGVAKNSEVIVLTYNDGAWAPAEAVTNNNDGTVTVVFEHFCPTAFCVEENAQSRPPQTGDAAAQDLTLWAFLMVASLAAMVVLTLHRRKHAR